MGLQRKLIAILLYLPLFILFASRYILAQETPDDKVLSGWSVIHFPYNDDIGGQAIMFDSANGWGLSSTSHQLYRLQDGIWKILPESDRFRYRRLFGFSRGNIWFSIFDRENYRYLLRHFDGNQWQDFYTPNADLVRDLEYHSADNIWGVCEWGEIIHFNGNNWELVPCPVFAHLNCISMAGDSSGWIGGEYRGKGILLRWNGKEWKIAGNVPYGEITNIITVNSLNGWAFFGWSFFGNDSIIIRLENEQWNYVTFSSLVQDTIKAAWEDVTNPIFIHQKGIIVNNAIYYGDGRREILYYLSHGDHNSPYLLTADDSLKFVKSELSQTFSSKLFQIDASEMVYREEYGVAFGDFDSDGDDDIYSVNTESGNKLQLFGGNSRIKSKSPDSFIEAADRLNILGMTKTRGGEYVYDMGITLADMDNDGDRDVYITSLYDRNMLYENDDGEKFREIGAESGVAGGKARSNVGIWGDVDNDGDVDLFVTNEDTTNMLFLNNGIGRFREVTQLIGLASIRSGKGATFGDLDLDGDLDLVVPYFSLRNRIYRNEGIHHKTNLPFYKDVTDQWLPPQSDSLAKSTSACLADIDNDGDLDLYITNLIFSNRLYENDGTGHFTDITRLAGVMDSGLSNSSCFFDADNDGDLDLFVTNRGENIFYKNAGNKRFIRDNETFKLEPNYYSTGFACGDPDRDGDIDCYLANYDQNSIYYENFLNDKNFLKIKLIGTSSNRDAIGAKVYLYEAGYFNDNKRLLGMREVNGGYGYGCMNSLVIHFGVQHDKRYDLKIRFPSGIEIFRSNLQPGQLLIIEEQIGWAKFVATGKRTILRYLKTPRNQIEFFKFIGLLSFFITVIMILKSKKWLEIHYPLILILPSLIIYWILIPFAHGRNFWFSHFLPISVSIFSFAMTIIVLKRRTTQSLREHLAEELLLSCKAFDHGSWATSYLNQLQLFSINLPADQPIPLKAGQQLQETIIGFYDLVYKEIDHIHQLALDASLQVNQATELKRQLLFLSENLNNIKIALALKQGLQAEIWQNVYRLTDQIRMNIHEINLGVTKLFSCDALAIIRKTVSTFQNQVYFPISLNQIDGELWVCIKPTELATILDNLLNNAHQAMYENPNPNIKLKLNKTDQHLFLEFSDNGHGIPKKLWQEIFDQNYTTKSDSNGGFGLYYTRRTLEKYGGSIEVLKSTLHKGTTFLIKLRRV